jgi:hypothetical protein
MMSNEEIEKEIRKTRKMNTFLQYFLLVISAVVGGLIFGTALVEKRANDCIAGRIISQMTEDELRACRVTRVPYHKVEAVPPTGEWPPINLLN